MGSRVYRSKIEYADNVWTQPRPDEEQRPWFEGTRGMGWFTSPEGLAARIREAEQSKSLQWLFNPHAGQQAIIDAPESFLIASCGRRFGKTLAAMVWAAQEATRTQGLVWWAAPTYKTCINGGWASFMKFLPRKFRKVNRSEKRIELSGGGVIEFVTCDNPDNLRAATLNGLVIDEAAYVSDYVWHDVLSPMLLTTGGRVLGISSPKTKRGWFYDMWRDGQGKEKDSRSWSMTTYDNPLIEPARIDRYKRTMPEYTFRREIMAEFVDSLNAVFEGIRELAVVTPLGATAARPDRGSITIGIDWARRIDFTVAIALQHGHGGVPRQIAMERFTGLRYGEQLERIEAFIDRLRPDRVIAETNNMGSPLVERLQDDGYPVEGFNTSASTKPDLIRQFQLAVNQREVELLNDPVLVEEMEDFEEEDKGQRVVFTAPERKHDDCVIASSLAWRGFAGEPGLARGGHFECDVDSYLDRSTYVPGMPEMPFMRLVSDGVVEPDGWGGWRLAA